MSQTTRGGRAALTRIEDDLRSLDAQCAKIDSMAERADARFYHNLDLAKETLHSIRAIAQDARTTIIDLLMFCCSDLEQLLKRRDLSNQDIVEALQRLDDLERRIAILEES